MPDPDDPFVDDDSPDLEPVLPDGIGLSLDDVRALLAKKHETVVAADDPLLMMVTILNAFLAEQQKQNDKWQGGMRQLLADKTDEYVSGVQTATDSLAEKLQAVSAQSMQNSFQTFRDSLNNFKSTMIVLSAVVAISAIINVAVFVFNSIK
mgnify:CR=1 FL=1